MRRARFAIFTALALGWAGSSIGPTGASACTVLQPTAVLPNAAPAPRNSRVWVVGLQPPFYDGASLVLVASRDRHHPLSVALRSWGTSGVWELTPSRLDSDTRYEVWSVPRPRGRERARPASLIGTFRTSQSDDLTAPTAPTLRSAQRRVPLVDCAPFVAVEGVPGSDPSGEVLHAIWYATTSGVIDYHEAPVKLARWRSPSPDERAPSLEVHGLPREANRLGIRAVDVAGNLSEPVEISLSP